ncbi:MAG: DUF3060 domain-containing protein [Pseudomonadota bacterium]
MSRRMTKLILILAAPFAGSFMPPALAQSAGSEAAFISSGQTATLDCGGGKAAIMGSDNNLTITGHCTDLELAGSNNKIKIEFGPAAKISFVGSSNSITWTSADGKPPSVSYVGAGNTMVPSIP